MEKVSKTNVIMKSRIVNFIYEFIGIGILITGLLLMLLFPLIAFVKIKELETVFIIDTGLLCMFFILAIFVNTIDYENKEQ